MLSTQSAASRMRRASIRSLTAILMVATTTLAACSTNEADPTTGPSNNKSPMGTYALRSIDGNLPGEIYHGPWLDPQKVRFYNQRVVVIDSGDVELGKGNVWTMLLYWRQTLDGASTSGFYNADGSYEIDGDQLYLRPRDATDGGVVASLVGGRIDFSVDIAASTRDRAYRFQKK